MRLILCHQSAACFGGARPFSGSSEAAHWEVHGKFLFVVVVVVVVVVTLRPYSYQGPSLIFRRHTQTHHTPLDEGSASRRGFYLTTHDTH